MDGWDWGIETATLTGNAEQRQQMEEPDPMMFKYKSPVGAFSIRPTLTGRWLLLLDDRELASFASPQAAAEAVSVHMTGCPDWDCLFADNVPQVLEDWEIVT